MALDISWGGGEESKEGRAGKRRGVLSRQRTWGTPENKGVWARGAAKCRADSDHWAAGQELQGEGGCQLAAHGEV